MDKDLKNNLIRTILEQSGITDEELKQEFLDKYIDSDIKLKDIDRNLEYYIKKDKKKKEKVKNNNVTPSKVNEVNKALKYTMYKYNHLSIKVKEDITVKLIDNKKYGTNGVYHVLVNNKDKAYLKSSKVKYIDDIDASLSQIGSIFDIDMAKIYRVEDSHGGCGILSYDIKNKKDARYVSLHDAYTEYYKRYNEGKIYNLKWIMELLSLPKSSKENPLDREDYIKVVIDMGINILRDHFNVSEENIKKLKKQYLRILVFDYVTNQKDRSLGNVNLIFENDQVSFAPLYDNGCVYNEDIGDENIYLLDHICDREKFIKTIFTYYYDDIKEDVKFYLNKKNYMEKVSDILKNNLNETNYKWYYSKVYKNIDHVIFLNRYYEEQPTTKVHEYKPVDLRLQYGYVKTFSLLLTSLLVLLIIVIVLGVFV